MKTKRKLISVLFVLFVIGTSFTVNAHRPWRTWATYFGTEFSSGSSYDYWRETSAIAQGATSEIYVGGCSYNSTTDLDGLIMKFNSLGQLQWQTSITGSNKDKIVDVIYYNTYVYAVGFTWSDDLPNALGSYQDGGDVFVTKLNASDGSVQWVRYYGGAGLDIPKAISLYSGNVTICGSTTSSSGIYDSPGFQSTYGGNEDGFIASFDYNGGLNWGTYYGGSEADELNDICISGSNFYVTGFTYSSNNISTLNTQQGGSDVIIARITSSGTRDWGRYYGGAADDFGNGCDGNGEGSVVICGSTKSTSGISTSGTYRETKTNSNNDVFVARFYDSDGTLKYGTYYGNDASGEDIALSIKETIIDSVVVCIVSGKTNSTSNIATTGSWQTTKSSGYDGFLAKFDAALNTLYWGTYYGGTGYEECKGLAYYDNYIYTVGYTYSSSIPTQVAYDKSKTSANSSAFLSRFIDRDCSVSVSVTNSSGTGCTYTSSPSGGTSPYTYLWTTTETTQSITVPFGSATPFVMVTDNVGCTGYATSYPLPCPSYRMMNTDEIETDKLVVYPNPVSNILTIENTSGINQEFQLYDVMGNYVSSSIINSSETAHQINVSELANGIYFVKMIDENGNIKSLKITVSH